MKKAICKKNDKKSRKEKLKNIMDYRCPKRYDCLENRCAHHNLTINYRNEPVSSPCNWYENYINNKELKEERKTKIIKIGL